MKHQVTFEIDSSLSAEEVRHRVAEALYAQLGRVHYQVSDIRVAEVPDGPFEIEKKHDTIKWACWEEVGVPVHTVPAEGIMWHAHIADSPGLSRHGLEVGMQVIAPTFTGHVKAEVKEVDPEKGTAYAQSGATGFCLEFKERHSGPPCWVSVGAFNLSALRRVQLYKED